MTKKRVVHSIEFYCTCGELKAVKEVSAPVDVFLGCSCGHIIRIIAKEKEDGVLWSIEEID